MYFLPEEKIGSHHVSKTLNQNIKSLRGFSSVKNEDSKCYGFFYEI